MALLKLKDFDPDYRNTFDGDDVLGMDVYTDRNNEKIGTVSDVLVDEQGHFRYLVLDLGFWIFGKKVLLPIGRSQIDDQAHRIYASGMTREQAENLPEFNDNMTADYDYEEQVRNVYRTPATPTMGAATMATPGVITDTTDYTAYDRNTYNYQQEPALYDINDRDHHNIRLYQERLVANKNRVKTGEVTVGKHIETETARVSVPIEKERIVIERNTPLESEAVMSPSDSDFREGEVARIEVYEETPDIRKEAFVREEVRVRKEVDTDTVDAEETLRREELDINTDGRPVVEKRADGSFSDRI
jgi:uncharacterized protein (TIGR02271 family)